MKHIAVLSSKSHEHGDGSPTQSQKRKAGRKKFQETRHPIYKGVRRRNGKWVSELREPNKKSRIWLGTFSTPAMAAKAYDAAALALKGDSASFNFPDSVYALPRARSSSIRDIQCAAMKAASEAGFGNGETSSPPPLASSENVGACPEILVVDEEEVFNMPGILESMAEGLILTPPAMQKGYFCWDDDLDNFMEFNLWG
ncbi:UPF0481 protein [Hibiscus syriacus]|uniref:UPF0481 protein n=1 Tax=Hibiscus syriacus TaxID=106335 RepID=A0A6A2WNH4_HIBSY|nr:dehydration-responsive element-binding protein 1F-like [Hibiscus syriacus]KAE8661161.1 UPF0481 protein [Hibiscus syriacus]